MWVRAAAGFPRNVIKKVLWLSCHTGVPSARQSHRERGAQLSISSSTPETHLLRQRETHFKTSDVLKCMVAAKSVLGRIVIMDGSGIAQSNACKWRGGLQASSHSLSAHAAPSFLERKNGCLCSFILLVLLRNLIWTSTCFPELKLP